jgi:hypothetical protein
VRRLRRILLKTAAALSLLLCLAAARDWVNSYGHYWFIWDDRGRGTGLGIMSDVGGIYVCRSVVLHAPLNRGIVHGYYPNDVPAVSTIELNSGLSVRRWMPVRLFKSDDANYRFQYVVIPHWIAVTLFAIPPLLRVRAWRRDRRQTIVGTCAKCGYDLRATPARCPECGIAPSKLGRGG